MSNLIGQIDHLDRFALLDYQTCHIVFSLNVPFGIGGHESESDNSLTVKIGPFTNKNAAFPKTSFSWQCKRTTFTLLK